MILVLDIPPNTTGTATLMVADEHTAPSVGSGAIHVLATPVMINLFEAAALAACELTFNLLARYIGICTGYWCCT